MDRWNNRVAVVTGASSGIGEAIAKDLVTAGLRVVVLGESEQRLSENRSKLTKDEQSRFYPRVCDISNEADVKATFDWIDRTLGGADVLVNYASVVRRGNLLEMDTSLVDDVLTTNVKGVIFCTQAAFSSMKKRDVDGHIVHINIVTVCKVIAPSLTSSINISSPSKIAVTAINESPVLKADDIPQAVLRALSSPPHV